MTQDDWKARAEWLKSELDKGGFASAQDYQWIVNEYRKAIAKSLDTTQTKLFPMATWHGMQSN